MSDILTHLEDSVLTITINRLEKKNSITSAMYADMAQALADAEKNAAVRVVLFQGHETIFSAGNDIADFLNKPPSNPDTPVFHFLRNISTFTKPVLAAVAGPAACCVLPGLSSCFCRRWRRARSAVRAAGGSVANAPQSARLFAYRTAA